MASGMPAEEMEALVRRRFDERDRGNFSVMDEMFHAWYELNVPGIPGPRSLDGTKRLYEVLYAGFPDLKHEIIEQVTARDKVVSRWVARGTHRGEFMGVAPTGKKVEYTGINIYTIEEKKFVLSHVNWDLLGLFKQIGALTITADVRVEVRKKAAE
jgi:predicted ester cyclase